MNVRIIEKQFSSASCVKRFVNRNYSIFMKGATADIYNFSDS